MTTLRMFVFVYGVLFSVHFISYECEGKLFHNILEARLSLIVICCMVVEVVTHNCIAKILNYRILNAITIPK